MKTKLQHELATVAPSIFIRTIWEPDPYCTDIRKECDGMDDENPDDWQAWQSEIRATAIHNGDEIRGSDYLGGTWEKAGDVPEESNPDVSGYEPDMTIRALEELRHLCAAPHIQGEIVAALEYLNRRNERAA